MCRKKRRVHYKTVGHVYTLNTCAEEVKSELQKSRPMYALNTCAEEERSVSGLVEGREIWSQCSSEPPNWQKCLPWKCTGGRECFQQNALVEDTSHSDALRETRVECKRTDWKQASIMMLWTKIRHLLRTVFICFSQKILLYFHFSFSFFYSWKHLWDCFSVSKPQMFLF